MHILDLPMEQLQHILSYNSMPFCMLVCRELHDIEKHLIPIKRNEIIGRYGRLRRIIEISYLSRLSRYEIIRFMLYFGRSNMISYYSDITNICLYGGEKLAIEVLSMMDIYLFDEDLISLSIIGGEVFWLALSKMDNKNVVNDYTYYHILRNAVENNHIDIVEYVLAEGLSSIHMIPYETMTLEIAEYLFYNMTDDDRYLYLCTFAIRYEHRDFLLEMIEDYTQCQREEWTSSTIEEITSMDLSQNDDLDHICDIISDMI